MSKQLGPKALKRALDNLTAATNNAQKWRAVISIHCEAKYGYDPSDIDNDSFIDTCAGGGGQGGSMTAEEFHASMVEALEPFRDKG